MPARVPAPGLDPRRNSLNLLRLVLAVMVIIAHSWPLAGFGPTPKWGGFDAGDWAVSGFFAISGWLITASRLSSRQIDFLWRRVLRIYPAFLACLLVVAFGFAPLAALLQGSDYRLGDGVAYVVNDLALSMKQWNVGTTLAGAPKPDQWNGPLWSLAYEFACYLLIGGLVTVVARRWVVPAVVTAFLALALAQAWVVWADLSISMSVQLLLRLAPFFFAGAVLHVLRERVPWSSWAGAASATLLVATMATGTESVLAALPLAHLCLWLGAVLPFTGVGRTHDLSYGLYIYGWPVQQVLTLLGLPAHGVLPYALVSIALTVPLAAASWFLVERPAMRWRRLGARLQAALDARAAAAPHPLRHGSHLARGR